MTLVDDSAATLAFPCYRLAAEGVLLPGERRRDPPVLWAVRDASRELREIRLPGHRRRGVRPDDLVDDGKGNGEILRDQRTSLRRRQWSSE